MLAASQRLCEGVSSMFRLVGRIGPFPYRAPAWLALMTSLLCAAAPAVAQAPARATHAASVDDAELAGPVDQARVVLAALRRHPALRSSGHRERALREQ